MSSTSQTSSFLSLKLSFKSTNNYSNQSYNELISFGSIRKQLARQIPSYLNYINKKYPLTKIYPLNFEEFQKIKEEMLSIKKSINLLKKEKQKKLDEIDQLRFVMHQVRNGKCEFINCENNKDINIDNFTFLFVLFRGKSSAEECNSIVSQLFGLCECGRTR